MVENSNLRVFGVVGSPRRGGNTETLVDEVLAGAKEAGASIEKVILNELNIKLKIINVEFYIIYNIFIK